MKCNEKIDSVSNKGELMDLSLFDKMYLYNISDDEMKLSEIEIPPRGLFTKTSKRPISDDEMKLSEIEISPRRLSTKLSKLSISDDEMELSEIEIPPRRLSTKTSKMSIPEQHHMEQNLSFSRMQVRDIERQNLHLMKRISTAKSTINKHNHGTHFECSRKKATSAVNRKKFEQKTEYENSILRRKLEAIGRRRSNFF